MKTSTDKKPRNTTLKNEGDPHLYGSYIQKPVCIITVGDKNLPTFFLSASLLKTSTGPWHKTLSTKPPNGKKKFIWVADDTPYN